MRCCVDCFLDSEIRSQIKTVKHKGSCQICGKTRTFIYDTDKDTYLKDYFEGLLDVYECKDVLPAGYPNKYLGAIADRLCADWNIFNIPTEKIGELISKIAYEKFEESNSLFTQLVGIPELFDEAYLNENSLLKTFQWNDFITSIKNINRFYSNHINTDKLGDYLEPLKLKCNKGIKLYRARISNKDGYSAKQLGAPPKEIVSAGRANSSGISCLYLADEEEIAIREIRAGAFDYVTVGEFILKNDITIIDLTQIDKKSPFAGFDYTSYAINLRHLKEISNDIAKPLSRQDSVLDYLPTQYISDFVKSIGYAGIKYKSTLGAGNNFAVFDENNFRCRNIKLHRIKGLSYIY